MNETKEKILRVAFNLFLQKSYKEVSLKEIVDKVGLTKGAFYHHFKGKEELFAGVIDIYLIAGGHNIYNNISKTSLKTFISEYLEKIVEFIDRVNHEIVNPGEKVGVTYFNMTLDALRILPKFDERMQQIHKEEKQIWVDVINNSRLNGEISTNLSDTQLAKIFISTNEGKGMRLLLQGRVEDIPGEVFSLWNSVYNMIKT